MSFLHSCASGHGIEGRGKARGSSAVVGMVRRERPSLDGREIQERRHAEDLL